MLEKAVESELKWLEGFGFRVLKLVTPGAIGAMDRMILRPVWAPGAPVFVECKKPGERERALQQILARNWTQRGCDVREVISTVPQAKRLCQTLLVEAVNVWRRADMSVYELPPHVWRAYAAIGLA